MANKTYATKAMTNTYAIQVSGKDVAVVLACLRIGQEEGVERINAMPHMDGIERVTAGQIDRLCHRINAPDKKVKKPMRFGHTGARS